MGPEQLAQLAKLLSSLLVVDSTIAMSRTPQKDGSRRENVELLKEFLQLNPELQRGCLRYAERMRKGYQTSGREKSV